MPEYSFVLAGKYSVGKTSIFQRLKTGCVPAGVVEGASSSVVSWDQDDGGLDSYVYRRDVDGKKIKVTLWDTGGQERYESMTANYYRNAHAVILVYGVDEEGTLYALNEVVGEAKETSRQGENLVLALWGSKSDLPDHMHTVKQDAVGAFLSTYAIPEKLNCKVTVLDSSVESAMLTLIKHVDTQFNGVDHPATDVNTDDRVNRDFITLERKGQPQASQQGGCKPKCTS